MTGSNHHEKPRSAQRGSRLLRSYRSLRVLILAIALVATVALIGCGSSSPRFGKRQTEAPEPKRKASPRFSREAQEEKREDDRRPDPKVVDEVVTGSRDFRKEKNKAITPLDQSKIMRSISRYMGVPYAYGGSGSSGMDCSGYTMTVYKESIGKLLPRSAHEQARIGTRVSFTDLKFGDLVFFNTTGTSASHVGIYLGDDLFAHASVSLGVTISSLESSYYKKRYEGAKRLVVVPE
ncbi:MAG: NlpC/P60 family protein [Bacteroidota bacterium]